MIESIPHFPLGNFPTPVERLSNLERALGFKSFWIKRDDLSGPLGGGNKVRKLEYMFAAASQANFKKRLFTIGPTGSNHVRATTVYGKASGFNVECLLFKQHPTEYSETNYRVICEHAAQVHEVKHMHTMFIRYGYEQMKTVLGIGEERYFIAAGGSSPLGSVGYVKAVLELKAQIEEGLLPEPTIHLRSRRHLWDYSRLDCWRTACGATNSGCGCACCRLDSRKLVVNLPDGAADSASYRRGGRQRDQSAPHRTLAR